MYHIGVDIGGTNIKLGLVTAQRQLAAHVSVPFPHTTPAAAADAVLHAAEQALRQLDASMQDVSSVGVIIPGSLDPACEVILNAYNLDFHNVPFRTLIRERFFNAPVYMANDADGAALAELYCGALRGCKTGVLMTLGTGVGGGLILDGKLFSGGKGNGVELGHMFLLDGGAPCTCGNHGCIESYCSATALAHAGAVTMRAHPESLLYKVSGGDAQNVDARLVTDCARSGDPAAKAVFDDFVSHLASACATIFNLLDPEVLAIGGGLSAAGAFLFDPLQPLVTQRCFYHAARGALVPAQLGNDAGMIGAAMLHFNSIA